ncbi:hypothetical protein ACFQZS_08095 [Mucilaginibacter calamicampi]|uniref:Uncharacterized protein n=1 Tax=Mucilaginibacter calamicampi TaxID=1302352 RepID=A0ABW2YUI8_9SPHI
MKNLLLALFLTISFAALAQKSKKSVTYNHFKTFRIDLNNDDVIDTIILSSSLTDKSSFNRISILMSGAKKVIFTAKDYWAEIQAELLASNHNLVKSKNVFVQKTNLHTVIIMSGGTDGAGYGGEFSIINIENNNIKMVFDHESDETMGTVSLDVEIPIALTDLERNDRLCFIYRGYGEFYKTVKGGQIGTYHPFFVFPIADDCKYSKDLSKTYNEQHYLYAGPGYNEKIEIFYPDNKALKPRLWKK